MQSSNGILVNKQEDVKCPRGHFHCSSPPFLDIGEHPKLASSLVVRDLYGCSSSHTHQHHVVIFRFAGMRVEVRKASIPWLLKNCDTQNNSSPFYIEDFSRIVTSHFEAPNSSVRQQGRPEVDMGWLKIQTLPPIAEKQGTTMPRRKLLYKVTTRHGGEVR